MKKNNTKYFILNRRLPEALLLVLGFLSLCLFSCIDVIDLKTDGTEEILIIEGFVYNGNTPPTVKIRKSASFSSGPDGVEQPVSGAIVTLMELNAESVQLTESELGVYTTDQFIGIIGKEYQLRIEADGNTYESLVERMPPVIPNIRLGWNRREETITNELGNVATQSILILEADANLPPQENGAFLRYRVKGDYEFRERASSTNLNDITCFVKEEIDFNNLSLVDGRLINDGQLVNQPIMERIIDTKFAYNYCFTVIQQSISKNSFNFWVSIENEFERTGDIFEAPPAKIKGNIQNTQGTKNDVIGLFSAVTTDTSKLLVSGIELGNPRIPCRSFGTVPSACFDCLIINNSSIEKPECFQ